MSQLMESVMEAAALQLASPISLNCEVWWLVFTDIAAQSSHKDLWRSLIVLYFHLECFVFVNIKAMFLLYCCLTVTTL